MGRAQGKHEGGLLPGVTHCLDRLGLGLSRNTGASGNAWDSSSRLISALQPEGTWRSPSCRSRDGGEGTGLWLRDTAFPRQPEGEAAGLISLQGPYRWARPTWSPRVWKPRGWADTRKRARRGSVSPGAAGATPPLLEGSTEAQWGRRAPRPRPTGEHPVPTPRWARWK